MTSNNTQEEFYRSAGLDQKALKQFQKEDLGLRKRGARHKQKAKDLEASFRSSQTHNTSEKQKQIEPRKIHKPIIDLPSFTQQYQSFRSKQAEAIRKYEAENIELLFIAYMKVAERKGIVHIVSYGELEPLFQSLKLERNEFGNMTIEQFLVDIYLRHLIEFEFYYNNEKLNIKKPERLKDTLGYATFFEEDNLPAIQNKELQAKILEEDIVVLKRMALKMGLDTIDLDLIKRQYAEQEVDLRLQNPSDYGFIPHKLMNKGDKMTLGDYCQYQNFYKDEAACRSKFGDKMKGGKIFFAVNFEPSTGNLVQKLSDQINKTMFGWAQPTDILSYLEQHINGCTNPQFYLKVKGCWTGGHQENVSMSAVNINHGPDASEWYTVQVQEVQRLRTALKKQFGLDLYGDEGLWFQKINWFIENGFKVKRIVQQVGDIVVSGPGTLHWVRSFGIALQSAWNIFTDTPRSWLAAFHRQEQNSEIKFRKSNIIPLKTLTLKHLDHRPDQIPSNLKDLMINQLTKWLVEETWMLAKIKLNAKETLFNRQLKYKQQHEIFCFQCLQEIFIYYCFSLKKIGSILCLKCAYKELLTDHPPSHYTIYERYEIRQIRIFIQLAKYNKLDANQVRFCSGQHIGRQCKPKRSGPLVPPIEIDLSHQNTAAVFKLKDGSGTIKIQLENIFKMVDVEGVTYENQKDLKRERQLDDSQKQQPTKKKKHLGKSNNDEHKQQGQMSDSDYKPSYHHSKKNRQDDRQQRGHYNGRRNEDNPKKENKQDGYRNGNQKRYNNRKDNQDHNQPKQHSPRNSPKKVEEKQTPTSNSPGRKASPVKSDASY